MRKHFIWAWLAACVSAMAIGGCGNSDPGISPQKAIDFYANSQMLVDKGDNDAALAELRKAVSADPTLSIAHCAMGDIYRKQGDNVLAERSYETACETNPYAFRPHYNLGVVCQAISDAAGSVQATREQLSKAVRAYLRALVIKDDDFDANLNLSACYFQLGKYDLAAQYCRRAIELDPKSASAYCNLGIIYDSQGDYSKAIAAYDDSLELDVHQPRILLNLGSTYMRQQRWPKAIKAFEMAAKEMPGESAPFEQIGACRFQQGEMDLALAAYRQAVAINPRSAAAHRGAGIVLMTQFVKDRTQTALRDQALEAWHRSLELQANQDDLAKLIEKYQPKPATPNL